MTNSKFKNVIFLILVCSITSGCGTLQQPLPGSLWGDWAFVRTGTLTANGNDRLVNYNNVCNTESDRLSFRSDNKLSLRWYDESCMINYYLIGRFHVEGITLIVDLENSPPYQDSPFPPIKKYRINQISYTTLKLEEIPDDSESNRGRVNTRPEPLVFVFMRIE